MQQVDLERAQMPMLTEYDPDVAAIIRREVDRQRHGLELIASENFVSEAVLEVIYNDPFREGKFKVVERIGKISTTDLINRIITRYCPTG